MQLTDHQKQALAWLGIALGLWLLLWLLAPVLTPFVIARKWPHSEFLF